MTDCRTCKHNSYRGLANSIADGWVSCVHPVTLAKEPKWEAGDPAMVSYRTGDVPVSQIHNLADCPTWAAAKEKD